MQDERRDPTRETVRETIASLADRGRAHVKARDVAKAAGLDVDRGTLSAVGQRCGELETAGVLDRWSDSTGGRTVWRIVDPDATDAEVRADGGTVHTTIEIDGDLWRELRAEGIRQGREIPEQLETILRERYRARADGGVDGFGLGSLESELKTVLARHNELLTGEHGDVEQAKAFAEIVAIVNAKMMQQRVTPTIDERSGVAHLEWPGEEVLSFIGDTANSDWLDNETIDVSQFTHIHIKDGDLQ